VERVIHYRVAFPGSRRYPEWRAEWCVWLRRHGFDPDLIPIDTPVIVDDRRRSVATLIVVLDENGRVAPDPKDPNRIKMKRVEVQLESRALPFPDAFHPDEPRWTGEVGLTFTPLG
jgi:hypothetical protein